MTREEEKARQRLAVLAGEADGRALLQLALRGIQTSGHGVTIGCWVKPSGGVSGCVFQHAYWQGVTEGTFETTGMASREIKDLVPEGDFHLVMERAIQMSAHARFRRTPHSLTLPPTRWSATTAGDRSRSAVVGRPRAAARICARAAPPGARRQR